MSDDTTTSPLVAQRNEIMLEVRNISAKCEAEGRDFPRFYEAVRRLAALPRDQRRATLAAAR